jgi:hypothetical protein
VKLVPHPIFHCRDDPSNRFPVHLDPSDELVQGILEWIAGVERVFDVLIPDTEQLIAVILEQSVEA